MCYWWDAGDVESNGGAGGMSNLGERISSLEATVAALREYESEHWHKLSNDLQPLMGLPTQFTREIARVEGGFQGKIMEAVRQAIAPLLDDIANLETRITVIESKQNAWGGAKSLAVWIIQTLVSAIAAVGAVLALGRHQ